MTNEELLNEREKEIFMKFYPNATTEDWINISRSLEDEIEEQMKKLNTKDHDQED